VISLQDWTQPEVDSEFHHSIDLSFLFLKLFFFEFLLSFRVFTGWEGIWPFASGSGESQS
jgi:hypothetical protein